MVYHASMNNQVPETQKAADRTRLTPALLDLDAALTAFRETVEPLLTGTADMDWDGPKLLARERAILQAGLVLVGQCIALLLFHLVSWPEVQQTARQRTQHLRQPGSIGHGKRTVNVLVHGGVVVPLPVEYVVARKPRRHPGRPRKRGQRDRSQNRGFYPVLKLLGIAERLSPLARSLVAEHGTRDLSFEAARDTLAQMGIALSTPRVARITHAFNQSGLRHRQSQLEQFQQGTLPAGQQLAGQRVVVAVDGGRARLRRAKRGRKRKGQRYHGYYPEWREPKLLTIYVVDEQGRKVSRGGSPLLNDGTFESAETFLALLEMHLFRLGLRQAEKVLLLADGSRWIWQRIPPLLRQLGCPVEILLEALDFYHATQQLHAFAQLACSSYSTAQRWYQKQRGRLKQGQVEAVLRSMQGLLTQAPGTSREDLQTLYEYFDTHRQRMAYPQLAEHHLPLGSGAVESLIRQVVNLRLKGAGKFWLKEHAEALLHARCWWAAGAWDQFRDLVLTIDLMPALAN